MGGGSIAAYQLMGDSSDSKNGKSGKDGGGSDAGASPGANADGQKGSDPESGASSGSDSANAPKNEAGWVVSTRNKGIVLRAPKFTPNSEDAGMDSVCRPSDVTKLDLEDVTVSTNNEYLPRTGARITYADCAEPLSTNGIRLADESGDWGTAKERRPTPSACRAAAQKADLPNPVPLSRIKNDSLLKEGTGVCVASEDGAVTHLWITKVNKEPATNDSLRTYVMTATQWKGE